jgi:iron(III) transport system ATP-binding protein
MPAMDGGVDLRARDLVVRFGATVAVDHVDLAVAAGELFMLLGPSGCGKTTLLRAIAGFNAVAGGSIHFGAEEVTHLPAHARNAGMVFQSFALWPHLSVAENVAFGLRERGRPRREIAAAVEAALGSTRLDGYGPRRIDELSGGEQQRVALARALVVRPRCLLLDEPLSNLDARLRQSMRDEIRRICKEFQLTTVYVTHDQKEALAIADRIGIMHSGRILQVGTPHDIYRRPRSRAVADFVGETNLIRGRVAAVDGAGGGGDGDVHVETEVGRWVAARDDGFAPPAGAAVWVSVRPECFRLQRIDERRPNVFRGRREATVYLGELAEHRVRVGDRLLAVYELNPAAVTGAATDQPIALQVDASDVVLLPFDETERP